MAHLTVDDARDFDLHGFVGVRVLSDRPGDVQVVRRQLGLEPTTLTREPDLTVRFVDALTREPLTHVGRHETAYADGTGFVVFRGRGGSAARTLVPFDEIGKGPELVCERGVTAVPHLLAILNLTALTKGVLPLHATAFNLKGLGILVTGWAKSGKTETLLAAAARGARYVGDEWVYLTRSGEMFGLPEPIRLWDWHLDQFPALWQSRPAADRRRVTAWRTLARTVIRAGALPALSGPTAEKAAAVLERQAYVQVPPADLFGRDNLDLSGRLDSVVMVHSGDAPEIVSAPASPADIGSRMLWSLADERAPFLAHYRQFRYAFPERASELVDDASVLEERLLSSVLEGRPAATVSHPYPCDIAALGDAVVAAALDGCARAAAPVPTAEAR
jgi:hypothetical protein